MENNYTDLSENLFTIFFKVALILVILTLIAAAYLSPENYFIIGILSFVVIGWIFVSKIFSLKEVSFNEHKVKIGKREFNLNKVEKIRTGLIGNEYIIIEKKKYYFFGEILSKKKTNVLLSYIRNSKNSRQQDV